MTTTIRDPQFKIVGYVEETGSGGRLVARDASFQVKGYCLVELQFSQVSPCLPTAMSVTAYPRRQAIHLPLRS